MPPGVPFPQFATALRSGTVPTSRSSFAQLNRYNPPPRPAFVGGKGSPCERKRGAFVRKRVKASFDPKEFLAKVGEGKTISKYRSDQIVFSQGEVVDAVFYIQQGKIKLTVVSEQARKRWLQSWGAATFW
jgi:CRP-like cAMP-binding protein